MEQKISKMEEKISKLEEKISKLEKLDLRGSMHLCGSINGKDGMITLYDGADKKTVKFQGGIKDEAALLQVGKGKPGRHGEIQVMNADQEKSTILLNGATGDITLANADFAEDFTVADGQVAEAGMVMALRRDGLLQPSAEAYDTRVVGVVSGAGSFRPGLILDRQEGAKNRQPIAMVGKAYCHATADDAPIEAGDLLTSSDLAGHAMKATDASRSLGAVIGKALKPLANGTGLIPIVITLQ